MANLSPMMQQYLEIKENNKDSILFFRVGDFYEMFFEDAVTASEELDIVLTGKDCGLSERAPMCGVPFHSAETYIARLVEKGYKVAICEQVEDPATAKGLVKRDIIRIITPGTVIEDTMLDEGKNNYLCAVCFNGMIAGVCFCDASTGEALVTEMAGDDVAQRVISEIGRFSPKELLIAEKQDAFPKFKDFIDFSYEGTVTAKPDIYFAPENSEALLLEHFGAVSTENIGVVAGSPSQSALGAVIRYLYETGISGNIAVNKVQFYNESQYMRLNLTAIRNLEIVETMRTKSKKGSLLWALDRTKTAMGKRLMRSWAEQPLLNLTAINNRHNAVEELAENTVMRGEITECLSGIRDIERLMAKVVYGTGSARELRSLSSTIAKFPFIKAVLNGANCRVLKEIDDNIDLLEDVKNLIDSAIEDEPPAIVREGGMIRKGYNSELDSLREIMTNGTGIIAQIEAREKERTGIKTLKVKYNKVFGYYIEVSNSFLHLVPDNYMRRQTLTGGERFITDELKELETKVLGAKDRIVALEYELFDNVRKQTAAQLVRFQKTAAALAKLDVLCSFAAVAVENNYCRPKINTDGIIRINGGRHPVVERLTNSPFVANDTYLNNSDERCAIITGPNMAGKSTYMRQVAIIVLMAQIGSFVPATSADICICDAIFTRVGASDDLASGQSTFMVEMSEVADILNNATSKSLLVLDEIGRGTSTFDGMAIARAVLEYVADKRKIGAKALFATHYHELTSMEQEISGIKNYNIAVKKRGDDIIFLRRIVPGGASASYGIEVAKLAGIPANVIKRSKDILKKVESEGIVTYAAKDSADLQMPIEMKAAGEIVNELKMMDVNTITPIESMKILYDLINKAKE